MLLNWVVFLVIPYVFYRLFVYRLRRRWLRWLIFFPSLLLVTLGVGLLLQYQQVEQSSGRTPRQVAQVIERTVVERGDLQVTVSAAGTVSPLRQVPLVFQLSAPVETILVEEGDQVQAGDTLATLERSDLQQALDEAVAAFDLQQIAFEQLSDEPRDVDVAAAEAALQAARASFGAATLTGPDASEDRIAELQVELARNALWQAQLERDQIAPDTLPTVDLPPEVNNQLPPPVVDALSDAASEINSAIESANDQAAAAAEQQRRLATESLDQVELGVQIAEANREATEDRGPDLSSVASARAAVVQAEIALERLLNGPSELRLQRANIELERARLALEQARLNQEQALLRAPFAGVVARSSLVVGELPPQQEPAVLLIDNSRLFVDVPVDETDIVRVQPGQTVELQFDALPDALVTGQVQRVAYTPTRIGQLVTYRVRVELDPTEAPVRVGMSATARIIVQERDDVLLLRNRFIRIDRSTQQAFVIAEKADGTLEELQITLGERSDTFSEIVDGLEAGQQVVLLPRSTENEDALFDPSGS